jgi:subtilisin family serine protease
MIWKINLEEIFKKIKTRAIETFILVFALFVFLFSFFAVYKNFFVYYKPEPETFVVEKDDFPIYVPGEIIVKFKDEVPEQTADETHLEFGNANLISRFYGVDHIKIYDESLVEKALEFYKESDLVEFAEYNYYTYPEQEATHPNDPSYVAGNQWGLEKIEAPFAWTKSTGSEDIIVAVIDSGIDYNHNDLKDNIWINTLESFNGLDDDGNGYIDDIYGWNFFNNTNNSMDVYGHGTKVAGIIGAVGNNSLGIAGVNWRVKIMPLRISSDSGSGTTSAIFKAINYAVNHGAKIINLSYTFSLPETLVKTAIENANNKGVLFIGISGNNGKNIDTNPIYPASYKLPNMITVGASYTSDGLRATSNYGVETVHLAAPGSSILTTAPDNKYNSNNGTSFAGPFVTGAGALILSYDSSLSHMDLKNRILDNVDIVPALSGKVSTGGRLNLYKAIEASGLPLVKSVNVTAQTDSKVYDGNTSSSIIPLVGELTEGDSISVNPAQTYNNKNVGVGKILTPAGLIIKNESGITYQINYIFSNLGEIIKKSVTVSGAKTNSKVYDGNTNATIDFTLAVLNGLVDIDEGKVGLDFSGYSAKYEDKNVGTGKTVFVEGLSLTGEESGNYILEPLVLTDGVITPASLKVSALGVDKVYDGTIDADINLNSDLVSGDNLDFEYNAVFEDPNIGSDKTVTVSEIKISGGSDSGNYILSNSTYSTKASIVFSSGGGGTTPLPSTPLPSPPTTPSGPIILPEPTPIIEEPVVLQPVSIEFSSPLESQIIIQDSEIKNPTDRAMAGIVALGEKTGFIKSGQDLDGIESSFYQKLANIINIALGFVGILAVIIIIYSGFKWMTAGGNEQTVLSAKEGIKNAVIGIVIIFTSYIVVNFVIIKLIEAFV